MPPAIAKGQDKGLVALPAIDLLQGLPGRSEEHTSELQSPCNIVCRLLLEKKKCRKSIRCPPSCLPSRSETAPSPPSSRTASTTPKPASSSISCTAPSATCFPASSSADSHA